MLWQIFDEFYVVILHFDFCILHYFMAVPRHRHTKSKVHKRRMHIFITPATLTTCQKCKAPVRAHTVCSHCGYYKGIEFINVLGKLTKKERKIKEKEIKKTEQDQKVDTSMTMEELSKK